jgi:hypothetical protein
MSDISPTAPTDTTTITPADNPSSEIDRISKDIEALKAQLADAQKNATKAVSTANDAVATANDTATAVAQTADTSTVIGAGPDPRGGFVVGFADGTVKLHDVPATDDDPKPAPWGKAAKGTYSHFFVEGNTRYVFVSSDG